MKKKRRGLKIFFCIFSLICAMLLIFQSGMWITHQKGAWLPDYPKTDISGILEKQTLTDRDYNTLYEQTGLTKLGIDGLINAGKTQRILQIQEEFFASHDWEHENFGPFTCSDRIDTNIPLAVLEKGDIIVSANSHFSFIQSGHSAIVVDTDQLRVLNATGYGNKSSIEDITEINCRPTFMVLRVKGDREFRKKVAEYAENNLLDLDYSLFVKNAAEEKAEATHCSHLIWYAYKQFGIDLDSDGGRFVWPKDIANSPYVELVQVYGMDIRTLWN